MRHGQKLAIGLTVTALLLAGCATQEATAADDSEPNARPRSITGTATGTIEGEPDTLTMRIGVQSAAPSAQDALNRNAERAQKVIDALIAAGIPKADLQTTELALSPNFDRQGRITGYWVSNMVAAKTHDPENAGAIIDAAAAQAGDDIRVQGVSLSIEDTSALVAKARADAVTRARTQARQLARAAGVRLGPVEKITERRKTSSFEYQAGFSADAALRTASPIEPGTQELSVDVTVVFAIR
jgi:uncharacterized protein YggE